MFAVVCMGCCTTGVREVRAVGHVLLLPGLSIAGQENAGPAVAQEDGYRAVVGLARALARRRCEGVGLTADPERPACASLSTPQHVDSGVPAQRLSDRSLSASLASFSA